MKDLLIKIGLTDGEARVYLALLELQTSTTGAIIDKSQITSSKVYVILERLEQKGLVSHIIKNNVKHFTAANPERLHQYMEKKVLEVEENKKRVDKLIPQLKKLQSDDLHPDATVFQGIKGFESARSEFISTLKRGDEYIVFGSSASDDGAFATRIYEFAVDNEKKGIKTRLLFNHELKSLQKKFSKFKLTSVRFVKDILPTSIAVSKTHVLQMAYDKPPIQVLITSSSLSKSFYNFFESMWKQAK